MAVGLDFLSKTKMSGMKDIMGANSAQKTSTSKNSGASNSLFANKSSEKTEKANSNDVANMGTSDLLKYVYNNKGMDNNDIKLPVTVKYDDQDFAANGKKFDEVVNDICKKTGDSKTQVESDLKKKYMTAGGSGKSSGNSLNMQA